jgi:hypothetical protein
MEVQLVSLHTFCPHYSNMCACGHWTDQSILPDDAGMPMLYPSISLDITVLLLEPGNAEYHVIMGDRGDI